MTSVFKCPVCAGRQKVERMFYRDASHNDRFTLCRSCQGTGVYVVISPDEQVIDDDLARELNGNT